MLRVLGSPQRMCDGVTRRDALWAGGLGLFGLGLDSPQRLLAGSPGPVLSPEDHGHRAVRGFGRAKSCILLFLYGSPSQLETFDPKPDAPPEIRGDLRSIRSRLPGADVCELLPRTAAVMDKVTVVRSLTHPYPIHGVAYATTGVPAIDVPMELNPRDPRHWPFVGSVVDYKLRQAGKRQPGPAAARGRLPDNIALPFPFSSRRVGEVPRAGPYAAHLGSGYNPIWTEFEGTATKVITKSLAAQTQETPEPYAGVAADCRFMLATANQLPADMTLDRLDRRRSLLEQFDRARAELAETGAGKSRDRYLDLAYDLIRSEALRTALDLAREPVGVRESYGMTLFGQSCLAARRLVEAGSRFVTVFWDEFGLAGSAWDTHVDHYYRMKEELTPGFDAGFAGLIRDLDARGLLDETLVLCVSEHGRTPKLHNVRGGGRDHWSLAYSGVFAGGGVARGKVIGRTDRHGGTVADGPVSPKDVLATVYHLLGIDPHGTIHDRTGRPMPLAPEAGVIQDMLA